MASFLSGSGSFCQTRAVWTKDHAVCLVEFQDGLALWACHKLSCCEHWDLYKITTANIWFFLKFHYRILANGKRTLLQCNNVPTHNTNVTKRKLEWLEVLSQPSYNPNVVPSDYHIFRVIAHFLRGRLWMRLREFVCVWVSLCVSLCVCAYVFSQHLVSYLLANFIFCAMTITQSNTSILFLYTVWSNIYLR